MEYDVRIMAENKNSAQDELPVITNWQTFFDFHAPLYDDECFTTNTEFEADFLVRELGMSVGDTVLDIGCGTGRHAIALAKRGMKVTGVDLSPQMLARAQEKADAEGVRIELIHKDAARYHAEEKFRHAICLCEGALCLLGGDDDPFERDLRILKNIYLALKPGGKFLTTVLNAMRMIREHSDESVKAGKFDPLTTIECCQIETRRPEGPQSFISRERGYTPSEFTRLVKHAGFLVDHVWGGTAGAWHKAQVSLDEIEIMALCHKNA